MRIFRKSWAWFWINLIRGFFAFDFMRVSVAITKMLSKLILLCRLFYFIIIKKKFSWKLNLNHYIEEPSGDK